MSTEELRFEPMSTGSLLDRAIRIYTQNFPLMLGIAAIVYIPVVLIQLLATFGEGTESVPAVVATAAGVFILAFGFLIVTPLAAGATTKAVSERYLGRSVTAGAALKVAWSKVATLLLTQLVVGLIVWVGMLLFIIPGILWACSYALIAPIAILETSDRRAIRNRSWNLVQGGRFRVFAVWCVVFGAQLLVGGATGLVTAVGLEAGSDIAVAVELILTNVVDLLFYPFYTIAITLLYYDFRIRKEGFDLEMLSEAIGTPTGSE